MPTDHNIRQLIINKMTDAQYAQAVKSADELYLTPDTGGGGGGSGTVTSVRVQAGTGLTSSQSTAQTQVLNTTISVASGYKLPTTTEWNNKQDALPSQSGQSGKFLTTDGTNPSWATVSTGDSLPDQTGQDGKFLTTDGTDASWATVDRVTSVVAGSSANKINVTKNGTTSTITVNNVANATNATNATSANKTSGMYDKYYRAYAGAAISTYGLVMKGANGRLYPLTTPSYDTASTKAVTTTGLRPDFIWLYDGNAAVSAGGVIKADVLYPEYGSTAGNKYLNSTVPTYCDIYLCGDYDATKDLFYLSTTNASGTASTTSFYALVPYNSEPTYSNYFIQGRYYIYLGSSYSTANYFQLKTQHPLYYFDGTQLVKVSKRLADLAGPKFLTFTNVSASTWVADNTYQDYGYKCVLTCNGVTSNDYAQVIFSPSDASSGNYANVCLTGTDTVTIYSKTNTSITILSIIILGA